MVNTQQTAVLEVKNLSVALVATGNDIISEIDFTLQAGEVLGLVGESGSGKTTLSSALLGYTRHGAKIISGYVILNGQDILKLSDQQIRQIRGRRVAHVAQDPGTALNPALKIGQQFDELLEVHQPELTKAAHKQKILKILKEVGLASDNEFLKRYPHQLSGGQQQRVLLALAFILQPQLIILDEPTTALDVTTQSLVLNIIRQLCQEYQVAAIYVSHDLTVIKDIAHRVIVLYSGRIAEDAWLENLFEQPRHPYSFGLIQAIPDVAEKRELNPIQGHAPSPNHRSLGCAFSDRCAHATAKCRTARPHLASVEGAVHPHFIACHHPDWYLDTAPVHAANILNDSVLHIQDNVLRAAGINAWYGQHQVLFDVSLQIQRGECLALVGESGSGKTTLSKAIAGINESVTGELTLEGQTVPFQAKNRSLKQRHKLQYIFQNPYKALNPIHTIEHTLTKVVQHFFKTSATETAQRVSDVLKQVSLPDQIKYAYPRDLSGGERQRIAIARALLCQPDILICDEITSALDVSVQASILKLLQQLQQQGVTILFVTHNLGVVRAIADRVAVLQKGKIVETGDTDQVLSNPKHPYTQLLLAHAPSLFKTPSKTVSEQQLSCV
ncbi:ABC transporter ATP-binding protein [Acinetobacter sp. ANC 5380]|uniref:ABC transporter ATP-binding protein n=1 Tax=Acinetobacter terrae TaxID=2731247 RepID=A0A7Y2RD80_9GAMM|nr:ABC transporter ATP-binding protein [Acinetobacter terrae]NNH76454.1 ABC transporter ATP-binding protein [Acinetobacter terrae]